MSMTNETPQRDLQSFIKSVEMSHFRTVDDTGANSNALLIWNLVRQEAGLPRLTLADLPAFCSTHQKYHVINADYGCVRCLDPRPESAA